MEWLGGIADWIGAHLPGFLTGASGTHLARRFFSVDPATIPVCNTVIRREGRGFPWNRQIAVHPLDTGRVEFWPLEAPKVNPRINDSDEPDTS